VRLAVVRAVVGVVVVLAIAAAPTYAATAPTWTHNCATAPAGYTGTDATVAALTQLDADTDASCDAIVERLDRLELDVQDVPGKLDTLATKQDTGNSSTSSIASTVSGWTSDHPLDVALAGGTGTGQAVQVTNWPTSQPVSFDSTASGQLDGQAQSTHGDLWVLIGVLVGCFAFDIFLRKVWP
jgi:hypothetical protein